MRDTPAPEQWADWTGAIASRPKEQGQELPAYPASVAELRAATHWRGP
ncbi:hypothetical protein [Streptomyces sp. NPDC006463]